MSLEAKTCRRMSSCDFQEQIKRTGAYATPGEKPGVVLPSVLATAIFHMLMARIYVIGYLSARRPNFEVERWADFGFRVYRLVEGMGGKIRIDGFERIKEADMPVVWVSNHMSSLETYLLPSLLTTWSRLMVVLKEPLAHYPLFGRVVRAVDPIRLKRENAMDDLRKVMTEGSAGLKNGRSALIFPQGKRMRRFDPESFNSLGAKLAARAGVPVVPLAVCMDFLRVGEWQRDLFASVHIGSTVRISCGEPIPSDLPQGEIQARCRNFICAKLGEWQRESGLVLLEGTERK